MPCWHLLFQIHVTENSILLLMISTHASYLISLCKAYEFFSTLFQPSSKSRKINAA
jgi:hypothetical protein